MQKRLLPIAVIVGILSIVAVTGYNIPVPAERPPVRILLDNKGGKVIFQHRQHMEAQGKECGTCHHTTGEDQSPPSCKTCHVKKFDQAFIDEHQSSMDDKLCAACHHPGANITKFSHTAHADDYAADDCQACHHDKTIESEPQNCANCHKDKPKANQPSLMKAAHTRCADCHQDWYEAGARGCKHCHDRDGSRPSEPQACSDCHSGPVDQLIPTTTAAFHGQCMSCHQKQDSGPFGDAACGKCHMK
ncbi:cytochrome c3 family protein [Pseudodesulfovibrio sp.]|uniref:cytochrome c3 family protein n=1 Tax=unclassified Pseudodesulfovibrio TaxID=2661612 RepID=UPI003B00F867